MEKENIILEIIDLSICLLYIYDSNKRGSCMNFELFYLQYASKCGTFDV